MAKSGKNGIKKRRKGREKQLPGRNCIFANSGKVRSGYITGFYSQKLSEKAASVAESQLIARSGQQLPAIIKRRRCDTQPLYLSISLRYLCHISVSQKRKKGEEAWVAAQRVINVRDLE